MPALQRFVAALVFLSAVPLAAQDLRTIQPAEGCEAAPPDAVLELPAPVGYWARIVCTPTGHTLAPAAGDAWEIKEDLRAAGIEAGAGGDAPRAATSSPRRSMRRPARTWPGRNSSSRKNPARTCPTAFARPTPST